MLQLAAAGLGLLLLLGRRFGAPDLPPAARRRSPLEHVEALAGAYRGAGARAIARRRLLAGLARRLGRPVPREGAEPAFLEELTTRLPAGRDAAEALLNEWRRGERADLVVLGRRMDDLNHGDHTKVTEQMLAAGEHAREVQERVGEVVLGQGRGPAADCWSRCSPAHTRVLEGGAGVREDARDPCSGDDAGCALRPYPVHSRPDADRRDRRQHAGRAAAPLRLPPRSRSSPICCSRTRSTVPRRKRRRRFWKRWPSARSRLTAFPIVFRRCSRFSLRRTRSSTRGRYPLPRSAARPLSAQDLGSLPRCGRRACDLGSLRAGVRCGRARDLWIGVGDQRRGAARAAGRGSQRPRGRKRPRLHHPPDPRHPRRAALPPWRQPASGGGACFWRHAQKRCFRGVTSRSRTM